MSERVAVFGGDGRVHKRYPIHWCVYPGSRYGGRGPVRNLLQSIAVGAVDRVVILARWSGHSDTAAVVRACRANGVLCTIVRSMRELW